MKPKDPPKRITQPNGKNNASESPAEMTAVSLEQLFGLIKAAGIAA